MKVVTAPQIERITGKSLFIAGGISGCSNWQQELIQLLRDEKITILNPRRNKYEDYENIEEEQISWEHIHLRKADAISFWFPNETLCPITLFELGKALMLNKKVFIGVDPKYKRKSDVEIQTKLSNPDIKIVYSLKEIADQIKAWA